MTIDSHCHPQYFEEDCIKEALESGLEHIMCVATKLSDFELLKQIQNKHKIDISLGEHPLNDFSQPLDWSILENAAKNKQIQAIGECGFDFQSDIKIQEKVFNIQAKIAQEYNLPLILHTRDCEDITMQSIKKHPNLKGVFHCFTGSKKLAQFAIENGWYISFSGIITFKNAQELRDILKIVPQELILVETDSPYLAPVPFRGKTNHPKFVKYVTQKAAETLDIEISIFSEQIKNNYIKLFNK